MKSLEIISKIDEKRILFVKSLSHKDILDKRITNEWGLSELIEHLVMVETRLLSNIELASQKLPKRNFIDFVKRLLVKLVMKNGIKVPVPTEAVIPKNSDTIENLVKAWKENAEKLLTYFKEKDESYLRSTLCFKHPIAGNLSILETLEFIDLHLQYHVVRSRKIGLL